MQQYIVLNNNIKSLNNNQVLIYFTQKKFTDKRGICRLTQHQIADYSGVPYDTVVDNMNDKYYEVVECTKFHEKCGDKAYQYRNIYHFREKRFFFVDINFTRVKASRDALAFILKLKAVCLINTNKCAYNKTQLAKVFNISWNSVNKYIKAAEGAGLLRFNKGCFEIHCAGINANAVKNKKLTDGEKAYETIKEFCEGKGVKKPFFNERLVMNLVEVWHINTSLALKYKPTDNDIKRSLLNRLEAKCKVKSGRTYSLLYFFKCLLNVRMVNNSLRRIQLNRAA